MIEPQILLLFFGCNPCDMNALSSAARGDDVVAACALPPKLAEWHASGAQEPPDDVTISGLPGAPQGNPVTRTYVTPTY
jgi:hypothetical protein